MEIYKRYDNEKLTDFARSLKAVQETMNIKVSSRGWSYILENQRLINKDDFDRIAVIINNCRKKGLLPVDFVKEEDARSFNGVETPDDKSPVEFFGQCLNDSLESATFYDVDWWNAGNFEHGERKRIVESEGWNGLAYETLKNYGSVCEMFKMSHRCDLSFKHHMICSSLQVGFLI